jgi:hypothetical protein
MEAFDLTATDRVVGIICAWCNREILKPVKAFDGRMLCANQFDCWRVGVKLNRVAMLRAWPPSQVSEGGPVLDLRETGTQAPLSAAPQRARLEPFDLTGL